MPKFNENEVADLLHEGLPWQGFAECRKHDPELFFSPDNERKKERADREALAKAVCARCVVIEKCKNFAVTHQVPHGVWGGLTEDDRKKILNSNIKQQHQQSGAA